MLSYRHSFHAGNHADVLKHLVLLGLLQQLCSKPTPLCYFETHAGAGRYRIDSAEARKTAEYKRGAARLLQEPARDALLADYLHLLRPSTSDAAAQHYPGSPWIAQSRLRAQDQTILCELHPQDDLALRRNLGHRPNVSIHQRDGFEALGALLPPAQTRGLVLIDPAYELKQDYQHCISSIKTLHRRFRAAVIALWYPRLPRDPARIMLQELCALPGIEKLHVRLDVQEALGDYGMYGSGMLILQPPWKLAETLQATLTEVAPRLGPATRWQIEEGKNP